MIGYFLAGIATGIVVVVTVDCIMEANKEVKA